MSKSAGRAPESLYAGALARLHGRVSIRLCVLAGLLAGLLAACSHSIPPASPIAGRYDQLLLAENFDHELLARAIFEESNRVRAAHGVPALARSRALDAAADEQASYLVLAMKAEHSNPFPGAHTVRERVERAGIHGGVLGENALWIPALRPVGAASRNYTYSEYASFLLAGWMNSPGHRANLLNPVFRQTGCATRFGHAVMAVDRRVYATQVFFAESSGTDGAAAGAPSR